MGITVKSMDYCLSYNLKWRRIMWNPKIIDTDKVLYVAIADAIERDVQLGVLKSD